MKTDRKLTLPTSPEELQRMLADPTATVPEPLRTLLRRCAAVQSFDRALFDAVLADGLVEAGQSTTDLFDQLVRHPFIETLPGSTQEVRRFQFAPSLRQAVFDAAWIAQATVPGEPDTVQPGLQMLSRQLAGYYADKDNYEFLYHLIAADQLAAARAFAASYQQAELTCHWA